MPPFFVLQGSDGMFGKIKAWLASRDGAPVAPDGYRRFAFPGGGIDLPVGWIMMEQRNEGRWLAQSPNREIRIVFSLLSCMPIDLEEDCRQFAGLVMQRMQAEGNAIVTRPDILTPQADTLVAQYEGREGAKRQFTCKMVMHQGVIAIAYVEVLGGDRPWLDDVAKSVLDSLSLSSR